MKSTYAVLHDYGTEGWKFVGRYESIYEAVMAREDDISNGGGTVIIVEVLETLGAYRSADYNRPKEPTS